MQNELSYGLMQSGEEDSICKLIHRIFMKYVSPYYDEKGIREFLDYVTHEKLLARSKKDHFVFVAKNEGQTAGMIEIRENNHISLLFVEQHGHGVGRELFKRAVYRCRRNRPDATSITVNSSPNAVSIYERFGFSATGPQQIGNGIKFTPMVYNFRSETQGI